MIEWTYNPLALPLPPTTTELNDSGKSLSSGEIVGIVIGVLAFFVIIFIVYKYKKKK